MTRAADRLIVCGSIGEIAAPPGCWYELIDQGLSASGLLVEEDGDISGSRVRRYRKSAPEMAAAPAARTRPPDAAAPGWLTERLAEPPRPAALKPSGFVDDASAAEGMPAQRDARRRAILRGNILHRLMQSLPDVPRQRRNDAARQYIARQKTDFSDADCETIVAQTLAVLADPRFAPLFSLGSRAEVPIVGRVGAATVTGVVDRLVVMPDAIQIADYKTNRVVPGGFAETGKLYPGYIKQLALYRAVLMQLYPDRPVRAALIWTGVPKLGEIPPEALDAMLTGLTTP
jgi:ATP-dependent helicase/nuclease subunit A